MTDLKLAERELINPDSFISGIDASGSEYCLTRLQFYRIFKSEGLLGEVLAKLQPAIEQARKEERERIIKEIEDKFHYETHSDSFGNINYFQLDGLIKDWQALQGGKK